MTLKIYDKGQFIKKINDDVCICVHESKSFEPMRFIILYNDDLYLGVYPLARSQEPYGSYISEKEAEKLIEEKYCDEIRYITLKKERFRGMELIKAMIIS